MTFCDVPYFTLLLLFTSCSFARCQDFLRSTYCWNQEFRLDCSWSSVLAIHEAYFTNDEAQVNQSSCISARDGRAPCTEDIRSVLNRRCSGMSHCYFDLMQDLPDRECRCNGIIALTYSCVPESNIDKFCNNRITGNSGYISSPGYPRFYPKVTNCSWNIESSKGQEMKLIILDLDMRPGIQSRGNVQICPDSLTILENGHKVKHSCGQGNDKSRIPTLTKGGEVQIVFKSNEFLPSRGFLLYYKFNGCRAPPPPKLGYSVYSNNRSALYMCCKGHVFNDSLSNSLLLQCIDGTYWNGTVTPCISIEDALRSRKNNSDGADVYLMEKSDVVEVYLNKHKYIEEILIPVACVVGLVFGNLAIILGIQRFRKKRKSNVPHHNGRILPKRNSSTNTTTDVPQTLHVPVTVPIDSTIPHPHVSSLPTLQQPPVVRQAPRVLMTDL